MKVIGLTGYTASGKSTVSSYLKEKGIEVIDADMISRYIMEPGQKGYLAVLREFGLQYLGMDGRIDRKKLGKDVFSDPGMLLRLNRITHPIIIEKIKDNLNSLNTPCVIIDAPLLKQTGLRELCDEVWIIEASKQTRLERLVRRDGLSRKDAMERIEAQQEITKDEKDIVFYNDASRAELLEQIDKRLEEEGL